MSYRVVRSLAKGGMGTVSLVVKEEGAFRRAYALKRLLPHLRSDLEVRAMFLREAEIAGLLHHPNVVSVLDFGEDSEGPFLVMDYVHGVSLHQLLKAVGASGSRLSTLSVAQIFEPVARGLEAAHTLTDHAGRQLGLVHRDVSPSNILVGYDGSCRLADFGIAKAVFGHDKTSTGILKGKLGYLAPEQLQFHDASVASDVYSLGVSMFEALSGRRLFHGSRPAETARSILEDPPPDLYDLREDVHPALEELVLQMLAKHPEDRPPSAGSVAVRLESMREELRRESPNLSLRDLLVAHFGDDAATKEQLLTEITRVPRSSRAPLAIALGIAVLGAGAVGGLLSRQGEQAGPAPPRVEAQSPPVPETAPVRASAPSAAGPAPTVLNEPQDASVPEEPDRSDRATPRRRTRPAVRREPARNPGREPEPDDGLWGWRR